MAEGQVSLQVMQGSLTLSEIRLGFLPTTSVLTVRVGEVKAICRVEAEGRLIFNTPVVLTPETPLTCQVAWD